MYEQDRLTMEQDNVSPNMSFEGKPICTACGAKADISDPNGVICTQCYLYQTCCTCDPDETAGVNLAGETNVHDLLERDRP